MQGYIIYMDRQVAACYKDWLVHGHVLQNTCTNHILSSVQASAYQVVYKSKFGPTH